MDFAERLGDQKSVTSIASATPTSVRPDFVIKLYSSARDPEAGLGVGLGSTIFNKEQGAVIFNVLPDGPLARWNRDNPEQMVEPGFTIIEVNGVTGYWPILEEV